MFVFLWRKGQFIQMSCDIVILKIILNNRFQFRCDFFKNMVCKNIEQKISMARLASSLLVDMI